MNRIVDGFHAEPKELPAKRTQLRRIIRLEVDIENIPNSLFRLDLLRHTGRGNTSW